MQLVTPKLQHLLILCCTPYYDEQQRSEGYCNKVCLQINVLDKT